MLLLVDKILDGSQFIQSEQTDLNSSHKRLTGVDVEVFCKKTEQNSDTICFITGKLALLHKCTLRLTDFMVTCTWDFKLTASWSLTSETG